ncbi:Enolase-phosphatase E1 [Blomia tropicalis]|nr:Enolase-phosphatase E1 [Blomia tropicalis]
MFYDWKEVSLWLNVTPFQIFMFLLSTTISSLLLTLKFSSEILFNTIPWIIVYGPFYVFEAIDAYFCLIIFVRQYQTGVFGPAFLRFFFNLKRLVLMVLFQLILSAKLKGTVRFKIRLCFSDLCLINCCVTNVQVRMSSLVRLRRPKLVLFGLHGTIAPTDWEEQCIFPYIRANLLKYLELNWNVNEEVRFLIDRLRQQSFDDHFVFETMEAPLIIGFNMTNSNWKDVLHTVHDYVLWQLNKLRSSKESICLVRLCWIQGFREQAIKIPIFDDVLPTIKRFKSANIQIGIFTVMGQDLTRLVLSSTTVGNIAENIDHFFDQETVGTRRENTSYEKISKIVNVLKSEMLFICDYGQDIKISVECGLQGIIIIRPGNRRNRDYYLIRFPNTDSLELIEFI